jgi:hypothetical protein
MMSLLFVATILQHPNQFFHAESRQNEMVIHESKLQQTVNACACVAGARVYFPVIGTHTTPQPTAQEKDNEKDNRKCR